MSSSRKSELLPILSFVISPSALGETLYCIDLCMSYSYYFIIVNNSCIKLLPFNLLFGFYLLVGPRLIQKSK